MALIYKMWKLCKLGLLSLVRLFSPRHCVVCGACLFEEEEVLCLRCNMGMPRTNYHLWKDNPVERAFWGKFPLGRATSYFFYQKGNEYCHILHQLKYEGRKDIGVAMGRMVAADLLRTGFFEGVDVLLPVPLHPSKKRRRGYNQSECIASGISALTEIPVDSVSVVRIKNTESQTRKSAFQRWDNVKDIFALRDSSAFQNRHVLIIDDVLTTGATITALADALENVEGLRVSVLTLAMATS